MRHMRVGVIGQTFDAVLLARAFDQIEHAHVVPIEVPDEPQDFARTLRTSELSAVAVCAPTPKRVYLIRKAFDLGLPVLAETPWASEMDSVASLLEEKQLWFPNHKLLPITPWRFAPDLQLARGILSGGALGEPGTFELRVPGPEAKIVRMETPSSAAVLLHQRAWQVFDLIRYLFGGVQSLQASRVRNGPTPESVEIVMRCTSGWTGKAHLGIDAKSGGTRYATIEGREGRIDLDWHLSTFQPKEGEPARIGGGCFAVENYLRLAIAFAGVAASELPTWVTDADLMSTLELVQAAHMSLGAGLAVDAPRRFRRIVAA